ncbi:putative leucine-rich repeat domain, L domain-containing protein [Medicago truncatula]|uniref:Putative leucine-rich repeat domain, L domain-containing protein n=1 Tax=Medicago truncatula TaxID=3880 RepID=A0A396IHL9_MEDTR|nr:F-box/LRR-repeat protein 2 [Medicago truncatula]RHN65082.1 putative leucine-rich repeat domain, L domain-containing protein [Medicago truncatula]
MRLSKLVAFRNTERKGRRRRRRNTTVTAVNNCYLSDNCWEYVFTFLINDNPRYLKSLSTVSKQFLSVTKLFSLIILYQTCTFLPRLFQRFTYITYLDLSSYNGDLNALLCQIPFPLNITSLNLSNQPIIPATGLRAFSQNITTLNSLICSNIASLRNNDLVLISDCFPFLEELDFSSSNPFASRDFDMNVWVKTMAMVLPKLRKVNLSGYYNIDDSSLLHLCKNCEFLEEVMMLKCPFLTHDGVASAIRERPTLKSLSVRWRTNGSHDNIGSNFIGSLVSLNGLTCLNLSSLRISDELLFSIAMGGLPLRRLVLQNCTGYNYVGIYSLLSKCRIQHLDLQNATFMNDHDVAELSLFLGDLVSINLSECSMLTDSAMFALVRNCPSLIEVKMEHTSLGEKSVDNSNFSMDCVLNHQLKSLHLACNFQLLNENIILFASIFPNLQFLDLSSCHNISEEGICEVLRRCCKVRHLNLAYCSRVKLLRINFKVPELEVFNLSHTCVDDETLYMISKNCCGLLQLFLENCDEVTENGVKHVVENCTQLREVDLGVVIM